jgi:spore germination protein
MKLFVYTVNPGDSLYTISQKFDVSLDAIRLVNGLAETNIVPGQALLINNSIYTVQPGDSFYTISQMAYVSVDMLINANPQINPNFLQPGMKIVLPKLPDYIVSTFSYFYVTGTQSDKLVINDFAPYTTYYSFFEFHFNNDGSLSQLDDLKAVEDAWNSDSAPLATITNLTATGFSPQLTSEILNNPSTRKNLIDNIFTLISSQGYAGVNIDFEGTLAKDRDIFSTFLKELGDRLHAAELLLTIAVHPKTNGEIPWLLGYDYGAIGSVADFIFIMAYDWHHMASEPGPVAPINGVRNTIEFTLENMDSSKVILGVPLYGYDWTLPYHSERFAKAISNQNAIELAMRHGSPIHYSEEYQSPYFYYVDDLGQNHVIWFEDSRSIAKKFSLVREYHLLGTGAWQIGLGFPQGPWLLTKFFNIRRVT